MFAEQQYAEADEPLPPVEEEETDRQQRVYRGQPSTVTQVQRDRDGILHQPSVNAIPIHGKVGSFAFGSQIGQHRYVSENIFHTFCERLIDQNRLNYQKLVTVENYMPTE